MLRISGCTLYSFAKTKGTIPCGRAACLAFHTYNNVICKKIISYKTNQIYTSTLMESIEIMKYDKSVFMVQEYCQELVQQNADATLV